MRAILLLLAAAFVTSAPAQPRVIGNVVPEDVSRITAAIRSVTQDRIVEIRSASIANRVGVQTDSGQSAGCRYLLQHTGSSWKILGKSCWTHTMPWPQGEDVKISLSPPVARPPEISESDLSEIRAALAAYTHDEIRAIKLIATSPLSVLVHTGSPHIVTEGDFTLQKVGGFWQVTAKSQEIH